jgi:hypothetical protein
MDIQSLVTAILLRSLSLLVSLRQQDTVWLAYRFMPNPVMLFRSPPFIGYADARIFTQPNGFELPDYWLHPLLAAYA